MLDRLTHSAMVPTPPLLEEGRIPTEKTSLLGASRIPGKKQREAQRLNKADVNQPKSRGSRSYWRLYKFLIVLVLIYLVARRYIVYSPFWLSSILSQWLFPFHDSGQHPSWYDARPTENATAPITREIPDYVFEFAPLVHLFSGEEYWPCDFAEHIPHTTPAIGYDPIAGLKQSLNISNLDILDQYDHGRHVFLTSNDNVADKPDWIKGEWNIPTEFGSPTAPPLNHPRNLDHHPKNNGSKPHPGGLSSAPAILITVPKANNTLDAFWFFFYSFNRGNSVLNIRFGNHLGDWEHTLVRFQHGRPQAVFYSEHNFGSAYSYSAVEKGGGDNSSSGNGGGGGGKRPILYSAVGTHAMYATPGLHPYILPLGLLHDETDRGPLWDPALNVLSYIYDPAIPHSTTPNNTSTPSLRPSTLNPDAPTSWFYYNGHWGDKSYPLDDPRQYGFFGEYHYVNGPLGPRFKHLGRRKMCQGPWEEDCEIRHWLERDFEVKQGREVGVGEEWPEEEGGLLPPGLGGEVM